MGEPSPTWDLVRPWDDSGGCLARIGERTFAIRRRHLDDGTESYEASAYGRRIGPQHPTLEGLAAQVARIFERIDEAPHQPPEVDRSAADVGWEWMDPAALGTPESHSQAIRITWLASRRPRGCIDAMRTLLAWARRTDTGISIDVGDHRTPAKARKVLARYGFVATGPEDVTLRGTSRR